MLFLSVLPSHWTSFVSFLFLCIGSSLLPAPMSYLITYGTQVSGGTLWTCLHQHMAAESTLGCIKCNSFLKSHFFHLCFAEKGVCISTVSLWILLVYTEASLRLKDLKTSYANLSHLFAAHWYIYWQNYSYYISYTS